MAKRNKHRARVSSAPVVSRATKRENRSSIVSAPLLLPAPLKKKRVQPTRLLTNDSRVSGEAARLSQHLRRIAAMPSIAEKRKRVSKLSLAPATAEPDARKSSQKAREALHCKKRPDSKKAAHGKGGSKRFVPWCS